ncbi:SDR family oxidoreductase [Microbacterium sp. ET2]|uniref:SDR family NAD(P)-dependent oxidoreductase n=1 Tax=Microbacterium albipurpureum TaxID=3050384 RepID=UPI00259CD6FF|nr:SDR family oxidoreductase [Microbacterium sp. ET2 (Ac-2212)]WJL94495.1 SDR family oxidoreductase [Microbacterium sp. ET2 (Ac-2212)]
MTTPTALDFPAQTVLITGASAGIGAEFAHQLAARGSDLVLVARRADRLRALADQLAATYGVRALALPADLSEPGIGERLRTRTAEAGFAVTGVVNNAGFANHGLLHEARLSDLQREIAVDVSSVVEITHAFLPQLRARRDGFVVNVASMSAYAANPTMAVYAATKAFVLSFTEGVWFESRGTGVRVMALVPGATETEFFQVAGEAAGGGARRMSAEAVARTALTAIARRTPPVTVIAGTSNRLSAIATRLAGRRRMTEFVGRLMMRDQPVRA